MSSHYSFCIEKHKIFLVLAVLLVAKNAMGHGGLLNPQGCHRVEGGREYHCHAGGYKSPDSPWVETLYVPASKPVETSHSIMSKSLGLFESRRKAPATIDERYSKEAQVPSENRRVDNNDAWLHNDVHVKNSAKATKAVLHKVYFNRPRIKNSTSRNLATVNARQRVSEAQRYLRYLGYRFGPVDGLMGPRTQAAIQAYQRTRSQPVTGVIDELLLKKMAHEIDQISQRVKNKQIHEKLRIVVERVQFYLSILELYSGPRDGNANEELEQAVMRFQNDNQISVDGKITKGLLGKIRAKL